MQEREEEKKILFFSDPAIDDDDNDNDDSAFFCVNDIQLFFFLQFFSSYLRRNKNIKTTVACHSISDSDICERLIGFSHTHIPEAPACHFSFILSFQIVTCLYSLCIFFSFIEQKRKKKMRIYIDTYMCKTNKCQKQLDVLLLNSITLLDFSRSDSKLPVTRSCIRKEIICRHACI
jgi:hypothetical protein